MDHKFTGAAEALGASTSKPKKEIKHIVTSKSHNGGHIHIHVHHHPDHHPDETHTSHGDDAMAEHMLANAGTPNPGEATSEPQAASAMQGAAPMTPSPSPAAAPTAAA